MEIHRAQRRRHSAGAFVLGAWLLAHGLLSVAAGQDAFPWLQRPMPIRPNVLLIVADDLGVDNVGAYGEHPDAANTPAIDRLASEGILFRNAWSNHTCSPTRATLLTGRYAFRTGVGRTIDYLTQSYELSIGEVSIPDVLAPVGYRAAAAGKWHLAVAAVSGPFHPLLLGFEHHLGPMSNVIDAGGVSYWDFPKSIDGTISQQAVYATTDQVDDALDLIQSFGEEPWFVWLAFNAPHAPYHKPPPELITYDLPPQIDASTFAIHYRAAVEAMDTEIERLLTEMDGATLARTVVIFVGDNGTPGEVTQPPFVPAHAKGTLYEGGINVPFIVSGPQVAQGAECGGLVNLTDVFATVAEIAGADGSRALDSVSLVPYFADPQQPSLRPWVYSQLFAPNGLLPPSVLDVRAARGKRYKLIHAKLIDSQPPPVTYEFYDLKQDPFEHANLALGALSTQEQAEFDALLAVLQSIQPD